MESLAALKDGADAQAKLGPFVAQYRAWITNQQTQMPKSPKQRKETGELLLQRAGQAADRIERGIQLLNNADCLEAFRIANRTMAKAQRQRQAFTRKIA